MSSVIIQEIKYKINKPSSSVLKRDTNNVKNKHFKITGNICQKAETGEKHKLCFKHSPVIGELSISL